MQLLLTQADIEQAIVKYLDASGVQIDGTKVHLNLKASTESGVTATIDISAGMTVAAAPTPAPVQASEPVNVESAPIVDTVVPAVEEKSSTPEPVGEGSADDLDREAIKKELDDRGIEYLPKAHTSTLQSMLDEARLADGTEKDGPTPPQEAGDGLFGSPTTVETVTEETKTVQEPASEEVAAEEKPLFGN